MWWIDRLKPKALPKWRCCWFEMRGRFAPSKNCLAIQVFTGTVSIKIWKNIHMVPSTLPEKDITLFQCISRYNFRIQYSTHINYKRMMKALEVHGFKNTRLTIELVYVLSLSKFRRKKWQVLGTSTKHVTLTWLCMSYNKA